jgi:hypothetical protein
MSKLLIRFAIVATLLTCAAAPASPISLNSPNPSVYTAGLFTNGGGFLACYPPAILPNPIPAAPTGFFAGAATTLTSPRGVTASAFTGMFYATDLTNNAVNEWFLPCPNGMVNQAPTVQIAGALTQLRAPVGIAVDTSRNVIYVANSGGNSVTMYTLGASGNVAPTCVLQGAATRLSRPVHIAIEPAVPGANRIGYLYVVNQGGPSITIYPPSPCGNLAPVDMIRGNATLMVRPYGIDVYETLVGPPGPAIYVADPTTRNILEYRDTNGPVNRAPFRILGGGPSMLSCPSDVRVSRRTHLIYQVDPCNMEISAFKNAAVFNTAPLYWYLAGSPSQFVDQPFGIWLSDRN